MALVTLVDQIGQWEPFKKGSNPSDMSPHFLSITFSGITGILGFQSGYQPVLQGALISLSENVIRNEDLSLRCY